MVKPIMPLISFPKIFNSENTNGGLINANIISKTDIVFNRECIYYVKVCYNTIYFNKKRILENQIIFL